MKVSIIIPNFNEEKNIRECLESLLEQSYKDKEIIVVDDGSTDKSIEVIKQFPVICLTQQHMGPAKARNYGVKKSKGAILVFMDADMTFDKNFLKDLVGPIIEGKYRGTFSKEEYVSNWENVWSRCWGINQNLEKRMIPENYPDLGLDFRAILKDDFVKVGGFSDTGYTDTWTLSEKLGYKPHSVVGAKYFHKNPDNLNEVFIQAKWIGKRSYKYGLLGKLIALIRASLPVSIVAGVYKSFIKKESKFLIFKVFYDLGIFLGILEMITTKKLSK